MEELIPNWEPYVRSAMLLGCWAGLVSALFNGVTDSEYWHKASTAGGWAIVGAVVLSILVVLRYALIGAFSAIIVAALLYEVEVGWGTKLFLIAMAGFVADPVLRWLKDNALRAVKAIVDRLFGRRREKNTVVMSSAGGGEIRPASAGKQY